MQPFKAPTAVIDTASLLDNLRAMHAALHEGRLAAGILSDLAVFRAHDALAGLAGPQLEAAVSALRTEAKQRINQLQSAKDYALEQVQYLQRVIGHGAALAPGYLQPPLTHMREPLLLSKLVLEELGPLRDEELARQRHVAMFKLKRNPIPYRGPTERLHTVAVGILLQTETEDYLARFMANPDGPHWTVDDAQQRALTLHRGINHVRPQSDEPYEVHLDEVVTLIKSVPHTRRMVAGAWLHDVLDDIPGATRAGLALEFDESVASLVDALSDHEKSQGNRAQRKAAERARIAGADWETQTVRVADVISNVRSIVQRNPVFARVYVVEKAALLDVLTKADPTLLVMARETVAAALAELAGQT